MLLPVTFRARAILLVSVCLLVGGGLAGAQEQPGGPVDADRVVVRFASGAFELVSVNPFSSVLPGSDEPPAANALSGFWYELQGSDGTVKYRRIIGDPVRLVFEGPAMDPPVGPLGTGVRVVDTPRVSPGPGEGGEPVGREIARDVRRARRSAVERAVRDTERRRTSRLSVQQEEYPTAQRDEAIPAERTFSVVVPRAVEGDVLVIFSSPLEPGAGSMAASEVGRLPLTGTGEGEGETGGES